MRNILQLIPNISTPFTFLAFFLALLFLAFVQWLRSRSKARSANNPSNRNDDSYHWLEKILKWLNITKADRARIANSIIEKSFTFAIIVVSIAFMIFVISVVHSYLSIPQQKEEKPNQKAGTLRTEDRSNPSTFAPPKESFFFAKREILVTGITCYNFIEKHAKSILNALNNDIQVYIIMLDSGSPDIDIINKTEEYLRVELDIATTLTRIKSSGIGTHKNFHLRFFRSMPPFTGIMTDGDVLCKGNTINDIGGTIRVQPRTAHNSQHKGKIFIIDNAERLQFCELSIQADDLRKQWDAAAWSEEKVMTLLKK